MALPQLGSNEISKIRKLIEEGVKVKQEVKDLNEGLRDTVKAIAEELSVPAKALTQAINITFKDNLDDIKEEVSDAEDLVNVYRNKNVSSI